MADSSRVFALVDDLKLKGNASLSAGSFDEAIANYEKGIKFGLRIRVAPGEKDTLNKKMLALYLNLAHVQNKVSNFAGAIDSCTSALEIESGNTKALYRRAMARYSESSTLKQEKMKTLYCAKQDLEVIVKSEPQNKEAVMLLKNVDRECRKYQGVNFAGMFNRWDKSAKKGPSMKEDADVAIPYAGLLNEGATCYLNAFLQMLYHLTAFRTAVFEVDTSERDPSNPDIILALQRLFFRMSVSSRPRSTRELLIAFGWGQADAFDQQDIHEFASLFFDRLEHKFKGTPSENLLKRFFEGHMAREMTCALVPSLKKSMQPDPFQMVQIMTIEKHSDLLSAMHAMSGSEEIEYKFDPQDLGGVELAPGVKNPTFINLKFGSFGPIILISLNRVTRDRDYGTISKNCSRFTYPEILDLADVSDSESCEYKLMSVMAHSGSVHIGHYVSYVRPFDNINSSTWIMFNDAHVSIATTDQAVAGNFGGGPYLNSGVTAYLLCYVRVSEIERLMGGATDVKVPSHISNAIETDAHGHSIAPLPIKMRVSWPTSSPTAPVSTLRGTPLVVPVSGGASVTVGDLLEQLVIKAKETGIDVSPPTSDRNWKLILTQLYQHRIRSFFFEDHLLTQVNQSYFLRAEWVPEALAISHNFRFMEEAIFTVIHIDPEESVLFGDPFVIVVRRYERGGEVIANILKLLRKPEMQILELGICSFSLSNYQPISPDEVVWNGDRNPLASVLVLERLPLDEVRPTPRDFVNPDLLKERGVSMRSE